MAIRLSSPLDQSRHISSRTRACSPYYHSKGSPITTRGASKSDKKWGFTTAALPTHPNLPFSTSKVRKYQQPRTTDFTAVFKFSTFSQFWNSPQKSPPKKSPRRNNQRHPTQKYQIFAITNFKPPTQKPIFIYSTFLSSSIFTLIFYTIVSSLFYASVSNNLVKMFSKTLHFCCFSWFFSILFGLRCPETLQPTMRSALQSILQTFRSCANPMPHSTARVHWTRNSSTYPTFHYADNGSNYISWPHRWSSDFSHQKTSVPAPPLFSDFDSLSPHNYEESMILDTYSRAKYQHSYRNWYYQLDCITTDPIHFSSLVYYHILAYILNNIISILEDQCCLLTAA